MKVIKAKSAGFCFGVNKAVDIAMKIAEEHGKNIYSLGELIHNPFVVESLKKKGINVINNVDDICEGTVIIRSHGVPPQVYKKIEAKSLKCVDATCPYVKAIQSKVEKYHLKGYTIVIVGDRQHPEVIGINGWCDDSAEIVNSKEEAEKLTFDKPVCIVAQTTNIKSKFEEICAVVQKKSKDVVIFNTICSATALRQNEAREISEKVDVMIVVGGEKSSNTKKLSDICSENCSRVIQIESADSLDKYSFKGVGTVGVTAGASTPEQNITEVVHKMENTMENQEKSLDDDFKRLRVGDIVKGKVIAVNEDEVYVDISYKSDGIIKKADYVIDLYTNLPSTVAIGDEVEAMVTDMNDGIGNVVLSKIKVDEIAAMGITEEKFKANETLKGKIVKVVKGGFIVDIGFTKAFMPANQYALRYVEDINALLGKEVEGRIIEFDKDKNKIIFSRRVILQEELNARKAEQNKKREEAMAAIEEGMIIEAPVKNVASFGVFLDLNGVDGFIHVSDLAWKRINKTEDFCKAGDVLQAKIVEIDREQNKVRLTIKGLTEEPWQTFINTYKVGDIVEGTVKSITKFGAFVEIIPTVEGLIHISNLSYDKVENVESVLKSGETVKAKIMDIDKDKKKIGLSIKDLSEPPKRTIPKNKMFYKEDSSTSMEDAFKKFLK